ncbi:MAG: class I SAM-dependent methyltransferase [Bdellovibrionales bacterium]
MPDCPLCSSPKPSPLAFSADYFRCGVCDLHFLHPGKRLDPASERARYESHNNDVDDPHYRKFLEPLFHSMRDKISPGGHGLDFGAGPGPALAQMFARHGFPTEVYDPIFWPDRAKLETAYDFVVSSEVVEHLFSPAAEFARLFALLKPGAYLGLMTLLVEPGVDFANWFYRRDPTHVVFYSRQTMTWIAAHFGFSEMVVVSERIVTMRRPSVVNKIP